MTTAGSSRVGSARVRGSPRVGSPSHAASPPRLGSPSLIESSREGSPARSRSPLPRGYSSKQIGDLPGDAHLCATSKLTEAAWRYDREKDPGFIHNLENRELDKEDFRRILKIGLGCHLTKEEVDSLLPLYDNNGKIDGFEFIMTFYHLRFEHRSIELTNRVEAERRLRTAAATDLEQRNAYHDQKNLLHLTDNVSKLHICINFLLDLLKFICRCVPLLLNPR